MRVIYSLLCFCLSLTSLLAYPVDYNETKAEITREALSNLATLISKNDFSALLQKYNDDINAINIQTYEKMQGGVDVFSLHLQQVQDSAYNVEANITVCLDNLNPLAPQDFYQQYTQVCVNPSRAQGLNLVDLGNNKRTVVFAKKYDALMTYFNGCVHSADPAPRICAGVVESTLQEVNRILPSVKANPVWTQRGLDQQILVLTECAYEQISVSSQRLDVEFSNAVSCILDKINTA